MALKCGIKPGEYLEYSPAEVLDLIDAYNFNIKWDIRLKFMEAEAISAFVGQLFEKPEERKHIGPWYYFPSLFIEEKNSYEKQISIDEFEAFKDRRKSAFARHNNARKGGVIDE